MGPEPGCLKAVLTLPPPGFRDLEQISYPIYASVSSNVNEDDIVATSWDPCEDTMKLILESIGDAAQFCVGVGRASSVDYGYY